MSKKITIYDIAKKLNTSAATVSRALNNSPEISTSKRNLILEMVAQMNYKPNRLAVALQSGKSGNVGVIIPRIDMIFFASVIRGIEEVLRPKGYQVIICQTYEDEKIELENINSLLNAQVEGVLMSFSKFTEENELVIRGIVKRNIPLIFFDRKKDIEGVSSVTIDDFEGGYLATKNLIDQGCTRIAHLSGDQTLEIYENRYKGYRQALLDNNLNLNDDYLIQIKSNIDDGREAAKRLLNLTPPPDGIFSSSDFAALGVVQELKVREIKVPEDFCVVGFGNEPFTRFMELSISSVDQSPLDMGRMTARVFLEQIESNESFRVEKKVVLKPKLEIRKSSTRH